MKRLLQRDADESEFRLACLDSQSGHPAWFIEPRWSMPDVVALPRQSTGFIRYRQPALGGPC